MCYSILFSANKIELTFIAVLLVASTSAVNGADILVPQQYPSIQAAVDAASNGDRVLISQGSYTESVSLLGKSIEIRPATDGSLVELRAPVNQRALRFVSGEGANCIVRGLRLVGSLPASSFGGGIIINGGAPRIESCVIAGIHWNASQANWGGAVDIVAGAPTLAACLFEHNLVTQSPAGDGGALLVRGGSPQIEDCVFRNNSAPPTARQGADLFTVSSALALTTLVRCQFEGVSGGGFGARIYNYGQGGGSARVVLRDCNFNSVTQQAISLVHGWDTVTMERVKFDGCHVNGYPRSGAPGVLITQGRSPLTLLDCTFHSNAADVLLGIDPTQGGRAEVTGTEFCGNTPLGPDFGALVVDLGGNSVRAGCCIGDITSNGTIDGIDLAIVLAAWGSNGNGEFQTDVNSDGTVNGEDLTEVLSGWGPCPE